MFSCARCSCENKGESSRCALCDYDFTSSNLDDFDNDVVFLSVTASTIPRKDMSMSEANALSMGRDGIIELLNSHLSRRAVEEGGVRYCYRLCAPLPHISQRGAYGSQWSCGYRNLQMLCTTLLMLPVYRACLFGGSGRVPDITALQGWIERAWRDGFDPEVGC